METTIFKSNGIYLGFIRGGFLYSRDGEYLGWMEGSFVWDNGGNFRGVLTLISGNYYILLNKLGIPPVPKPPRQPPKYPISLPGPKANTAPIQLSIGLVDGF